MSDQRVPIPERFADDIPRLLQLASAAESEPTGPERSRLIHRLDAIRSRVTADDPPAFRSVILRESALALVLGNPSIDEVEAAENYLSQSVSLGSPTSAPELLQLNDLASVQIIKALVLNDRDALLKAMSYADSTPEGSSLLAHTGMALSLVPLVAPDLMATSLGTPGEFTTAIPGWEHRVVIYGPERLDRFLLSLAHARLHLLRALNAPADATPSASERIAAALMLIEQIAPSESGRRSRWAKSAPLAVLAIGTICSVAAASVGLLGQSSPSYRDWASETLRHVDAATLTDPAEILATASWLGDRLAEPGSTVSRIRLPRYDLDPFAELIHHANMIDSVMRASQLVGSELHRVANAVRVRTS